MKNKLFLIAACVLMCACSKNEGPIVRSLKVSQNTLTFAAAQTEAQQVTVSAENTDWTYSASDTWVSVSRDGDTLSVSVAENTDTKDRQSLITIVANENGVDPVKVTIKQQGASEISSDTPSLTATPTSLSFAASGNEPQQVIVTATGGVEWDVRTDNEWVDFSISGNTVTISVEDNEMSKPLNGSVTIYNPTGTVRPVIVSISQEAKAVKASLRLRNLPESGVLEIKHYENNATTQEHKTLIAEIEPLTATCHVEFISGSDWFSASGEKIGNGMMIPAGAADMLLPPYEAYAEFIVRHDEDPDVFVTVKAHKTAMIYFDSGSTMTENREVKADNCFGRITTFGGIYYTGYSQIELGFYTDGVQYDFDRFIDYDLDIAYQYSGKGQIVNLTLFDKDILDNDDISQRTFEISDKREVGTAQPGYFERYMGRNQLMGSAYALIDNNVYEDVEFGLFTSGTVTVSKAGNIYTFEWDLYSDNGFNVTGSYTGAIEFNRINKDFNYGGSGDLDDEMPNQ